MLKKYKKNILIHFLISITCISSSIFLHSSQNSSIPTTKKGQRIYYRNLVAKNPAYAQTSFPKKRSNKKVSFDLQTDKKTETLVSLQRIKKNL